MAASSARRHETRALLRAHLAAAAGYRHLTRTCPVCHRLQRLAMERPEGPAPERPARTPVPERPAPAPVPEGPEPPVDGDQGPPDG
ncbi:DUF6274 family protein [Streptomyces sp. NPDC005805]|uniref:DUF6274 family protein n=1 Tax=Streptomyces sp. NPDC005805 TaxID=3157068 RepID=UPI0033F6C8BD